MSNIIFSSGDIVAMHMEESHVDEVVAIDNLSFSTPWSKESFENEIKLNALSRYVVAVKDNLVVGYGGMWVVVDEGHITNIAVHPEFRGIGIGNLLVEALIKICEQELINAMTLEVRVSNVAAINLYKKYDFRQEGIRTGYYGDNKEDGLIMWKHM